MSSEPAPDRDASHEGYRHGGQGMGSYNVFQIINGVCELALQLREQFRVIVWLPVARFGLLVSGR